LGRESFLGTAGLVGAVADTVGPVGLVAEAAEVVRVARVVLLGNAVHVAGAQLLQLESVLHQVKSGKVNKTYSTVTLGLGQVLGVDGTSESGSEDSGVLHLDGGGWSGRCCGSRSWIRIQVKVSR
jgi:hypothetical protein